MPNSDIGSLSAILRGHLRSEKNAVRKWLMFMFVIFFQNILVKFTKTRFSPVESRVRGTKKDRDRRIASPKRHVSSYDSRENSSCSPGPRKEEGTRRYRGWEATKPSRTALHSMLRCTASFAPWAAATCKNEASLLLDTGKMHES